VLEGKSYQDMLKAHQELDVANMPPSVGSAILANSMARPTFSHSIYTRNIGIIPAALAITSGSGLIARASLVTCPTCPVVFGGGGFYSEVFDVFLRRAKD